ncbi:hypothetical protein PV10_02472 [Exophiala mesophila]|uniref:Uncharacterized protein n=1 Tax=Exophiala mesophila TaxID=212818 RepID=A0A0D1ZLB2_EXOME|nr:uncharacterized protein PV10_02472 [Exophiala mesophila]KIV94734.1 hypothetical protein PV10_02472 [Exophiala mesophila]
MTTPLTMESHKIPDLNVTDFASSHNSAASALPSPGRNPHFTPIALRQKTHTSMYLDEYFKGPRDMTHHSKWPLFLRLHGSIIPKMIIPLTFVATWATAVTCISKFVYNLGINPVLLTITGFVVGLALSFRSTTAYERYSEGRKYWAQLQVTARSLARLIWIHTQERHAQDPELGKADILAKLTALNLINAFAVSLKHRLRFEPAANYPDLEPLIGNIYTLAQMADQSKLQQNKQTAWKEFASWLDIPFGQSNPRKILKKSRENLGNVPLEVLNYLSAYVEETIQNGTMKVPAHQTQLMNGLATFADVLTGTERVLNTPVPLAYSISISQITWAYILVLPFQLYKSLGWVTIFGTMLGAYIILGLAAIGYEIENPFGTDVNDLPLDSYCREIASDIDVLTSMAPPSSSKFVTTERNKVLFPLSESSYSSWAEKSVDEIRSALRAKATTAATSVDLERFVAAAESTEAARDAARKEEETQEKGRHLNGHAGDAV